MRLRVPLDPLQVQFLRAARPLTRLKPIGQLSHSLSGVFWREMGIAHGLIDLFVTEQLLHGKQINASHNEMRGKGVRRRSWK